MKFLLVSDLHYTLKQFDWLCNVAGDFDLLVLAGDHLDISSTVEIDVQILVVLKYLRRLKARAEVAACSGNHDLNTRSSDGEKIATWLAKARPFGVPTDGDSFAVGDTMFTVCPWWDGPAAQTEVGRQLDRDSMMPKTSWVWIYHAPPDSSPVSWTGKRHFGDTKLNEWIERYEPNLVLTGHIHQSPFRDGGSWIDRIGKTWVVNAGRQIGPVPTHIIFDTDEPTASWFSLAGTEVVNLDQPLPPRSEISQ